MSPDVEEQYKQLSRDYDNDQAVYRDLLTKQSSAELGTNMESQQQGEQMTVLQSANRARTARFPEPPLVCRGRPGRGTWYSVC